MNANAHKLSRRTVLKGVGVTMALPWLESIPFFASASASGAAAAAAPKRFAVTLADMRAKLAADGYAFGSLVEAIVTSPQFRNKRGRDDPRER